MKLGIDIGGSHIGLGLIDESGIINKKFHINLEKNNVPEKVILILTQKILDIFKIQSFKTIGIGIPGIIDNKNGIIKNSPNFPNWKNVDFINQLKENLKQNHLDFKIFIDNDANCAAYGEFLFGEGKIQKTKNLVHITLGTGVGTGIILNKKIYNGITNNAGEIGHMVIKYDGRPCLCGNIGCWEAYAGTQGFIKLSEDLYKNKIALKNITPESISELAYNKDKIALKVFEEYGKILGIGISNIINIFNLELITIGGGISNSFELFEKSLKKEAEKRAFKIPFENCKIKKSLLGNDAGMIGAAFLGKNNK